MANTMENAARETREAMTKSFAQTEKLVDGLIEFNATLFRGGETLVKRMYDNYVTNVAETFDDMKELNRSGDISQFYKVATNSMADAAERMSDQGKGFVELSGKVMKDCGEAGRTAFTKSFPAMG